MTLVLERCLHAFHFRNCLNLFSSCSANIMHDARVRRGLAATTSNAGADADSTGAILSATTTSHNRRSGSGSVGDSVISPLEVTARHRGAQPWHVNKPPATTLPTAGLPLYQPVDLSHALQERAAPPTTSSEATSTDEFWPRIPQHVLNKLPAQPWEKSRVASRRPSTITCDVGVGVTPQELGLLPPASTAAVDAVTGTTDPDTLAVLALRAALVECCRPEDAASLLAHLDDLLAAASVTAAAHAVELEAAQAILLAARAAKRAVAEEEAAALAVMLAAAAARAADAAVDRVRTEEAAALAVKLAAVEAAKTCVALSLVAAKRRLTTAAYWRDPIATAIRAAVLPALYAKLEGEVGGQARGVATRLLDALLAEALGRGGRAAADAASALTVAGNN